jgi:hypothetical protein
MRSSDEVDLISAALVEFHKRDVTVTKDSENPHFRSTFASLAANISAADVTAAECGLAVVQLQDTIETGDFQLVDALTTRIVHVSGQFMESTGRLHLPKQDPQGQGSAMTYGRRYNYQGAYGLVAEDDDGEKASKAVIVDQVRENAEPQKRSPGTLSQPKLFQLRNLLQSLGMAEDGSDVAKLVTDAGDTWPGHLSGLSQAAALRLVDTLKK